MNGAKVASFFQTAPSWEVTETRVGLKLKILRELNCEPIFEQVTPSRSSGKKEKAWGQICPPFPGLKGPKYTGSNRVKTRK